MCGLMGRAAARGLFPAGPPARGTNSDPTRATPPSRRSPGPARACPRAPGGRASRSHSTFGGGAGGAGAGAGGGVKAAPKERQRARTPRRPAADAASAARGRPAGGPAGRPPARPPAAAPWARTQGRRWSRRPWRCRRPSSCTTGRPGGRGEQGVEVRWWGSGSGAVGACRPPLLENAAVFPARPSAPPLPAAPHSRRRRARGVRRRAAAAGTGA
jgi:hypothetical protein